MFTNLPVRNPLTFPEIPSTFAKLNFPVGPWPANSKLHALLSAVSLSATFLFFLNCQWMHEQDSQNMCISMM